MSDDSQIKQTRQGDWRVSMDGAMETRTSFGTSARGHHYAIEVSRLGDDDGRAAWSRPFRTADQAEYVAGIRSSVALGDQLPSARQDALERMSRARNELSLSAKVAQALASAAYYRQVAGGLGVGPRRDRLLGVARQRLGQARAINQEMREPLESLPRTASAEPTMRPGPVPVVEITQAMRDVARGVARSRPAIAPGAVQRQVQAARPSRVSL